jgi:probable rRNA maturation factor
MQDSKTKNPEWKKHKKIHIVIEISGDKEIKELNAEYGNKDEVTDVLAFEANEEMEEGTFYLGDVIVNKEHARRQAPEYENTLEEEIAELVAHGVLHLLGVHHENDE